MMSLVECAVYVLYEQDHIKIGMSDNPAKRARKVTPDVDKNISYAMIFNSRKKARNCEAALHRFFSAYHLPARKKYGRTEFFNRSCGDRLQAFISENSELLGYKEIRAGEKLFSEEFSLSLNKEEREMQRIIRAEDEKLLRLKEAEERKAVFQSIFKQLQSENCLVGISNYLIEEKECPAMFIVYKDNRQKELLDMLRWNSLCHDGNQSLYLLKESPLEEGAEDAEKIDPEFYDDMERLFSNAGPYCAVYEILHNEESSNEYKEIYDLFEVKKNIFSLPTLEDEKLSLAKEILGTDQPYIYPGIHLYEEKEDGSERRMILYTREYPDEIALKLCESYWNSTLSEFSGDGLWHYVAYRGTARKHIKVLTFGRSAGSDRFFYEDNGPRDNFEPQPIIAKGPGKYSILNIHSIRGVGNHECEAETVYVYYENDGSRFYSAKSTCRQAYLSLQEKCSEKGWRIVTP